MINKKNAKVVVIGENLKNILFFRLNKYTPKIMATISTKSIVFIDLVEDPLNIYPSYIRNGKTAIKK